MVKFKDFSRPLCDFSVLFKADLFFKDFSRKPSKFKYFSSLCEPCRNCVCETKPTCACDHKEGALFQDMGHLKFEAPSYSTHYPISADQV